MKKGAQDGVVTTGPGKLLMGGVREFGYLRPQNLQICVHKFGYLRTFWKIFVRKFGYLRADFCQVETN